MKKLLADWRTNITTQAGKLWLESTAFLILIGLSGCVESEAPLSDVTAAKVDNRLSGIWRGTAEHGRTVIMVCGPSDVKGHPAGMMRLEWIEMDDLKETFSKRQIYFFTSGVGDHSFMNLIGDSGRIKPSVEAARPLGFQLQGEYEALLSGQAKKVLVPNYFFLRYEINRDRESKNDTLTTAEASEDIAKEAIRSGAIKGTIGDSGGGYPVLRDSSENLARFFQSDLGKRLFSSGSKQVLTRTK